MSIKGLQIPYYLLFIIIFPIIFAYPALAESATGKELKLENASYTITDTETPGVKKYVMEADLKATPDQVCGIVCDYYNLNTYMPKEFNTKVLKQESNQITLDVTLDLPWPFEDLKSILLIDYNKKEGNAKWKLIEGNLNMNQGTIHVEKRGEYSHMKQITYLDIGRYYPDWFIKIYSRSLTYKIMRAIRDQIEAKAGAYTKTQIPVPGK